MLLSLSWRNLGRNRRRTLMTGFAVATAVILPGWLVGFTYGAYDQMIDRAVHTRIGHLQVVRAGYLEQPDPELVVPDAEALVRRISEIRGVEAASPRAVSQGLVARDDELVPVELVGVDPAAEAAASVVPHRVIAGPRAVGWCRERMARALAAFGRDEALFGRWCDASGRGEFLPADEPRAIVLGRGVAERALVTVGDEITVQVVRAAEAEDEAGRPTIGAIAQRRLVVTGVVAAGSPEVDRRAAYLHRAALQGMLGTDGPNEIAVVLSTIQDVPRVRGEVSAILSEGGAGLECRSWDELNPALGNLIAMAKGSRAIFFSVIAFLIILSVANATLMSVLERGRELAVMLALGMRRSALVGMVMTEVALLGALAIAAGAAVTAGIEAFGRTHGFPLAWVGWDPQTLEDMSLSGVGISTVFHSHMPPAGAVVIVLGVYAMFLATGLFAALRVLKVDIVEAMRKG